MLLWAESYAAVDPGKLMKVYLEGNQENGSENWPYESPARQLQLAEEAFLQFLRELFFSVSGAAICVWQEEGRYCSALRLEPYRDGILLEALETDPALRRCGYARLLLTAVLDCLGDVKVYSHVHKQNTASLALHRDCGFQRISESARYIDGSFNQRCCTLLYHTSRP